MIDPLNKDQNQSLILSCYQSFFFDLIYANNRSYHYNVLVSIKNILILKLVAAAGAAGAAAAAAAAAAASSLFWIFFFEIK
jgi:hypothetical protein